TRRLAAGVGDGLLAAGDEAHSHREAGHQGHAGKAMTAGHGSSPGSEGRRSTIQDGQPILHKCPGARYVGAPTYKAAMHSELLNALAALGVLCVILSIPAGALYLILERLGRDSWRLPAGLTAQRVDGQGPYRDGVVRVHRYSDRAPGAIRWFTWLCLFAA